MKLDVLLTRLCVAMSSNLLYHMTCNMGGTLKEFSARSMHMSVVYTGRNMHAFWHLQAS